MKKRIKKLFNLALTAAFSAIIAAGSALAMAAQSMAPGMENPQADMRAAAEDLEQASRAFSTGAGSAQKSDQMSWSDFSQGKIPAPAQAQHREESAQFTPPLVGSPETGYSGTWTDPATGDIVTSVIAPVPRQNDLSYSTPIVVQPDIGSWNYSNSYSQNGGAQWPVAPGNPGYPGSTPNYNVPPPPPQYNPHPGGYYPPHYPNPPVGVQPGYRPLRPYPGGNPGGGQVSRPPSPPNSGGNPGNPGQPLPPAQPEYNIPGWKPFPPAGNRPYPGPVQPEYNIPGWKPFPPAGNQAYPPGGFRRPPRPAPRGAW
ncbi:MAG: hypothetical protein HDQ93_01360 [Desulfovibrio sp.]|nr:hypothetical protein [Desulfovibrio sp.]